MDHNAHLSDFNSLLEADPKQGIAILEALNRIAVVTLSRDYYMRQCYKLITGGYITTQQQFRAAKVRMPELHYGLFMGVMNKIASLKGEPQFGGIKAI